MVKICYTSRMISQSVDRDAVFASSAEFKAHHEQPAIPERKYALRRIDTGDYVLPSNDLRTLWRVCIGEEANERDCGKPRQIWELWRWRADEPGLDESGNLSTAAMKALIENEVWTSHWELCATTMQTRAEAIKEAMRLEIK